MKKRKYDFSKITTEKLREAVAHMPDCRCSVINCGSCPFIEEDCGNKREYIMHSFKEELRRREMKENKMPELEAGMIVEYENGVTAILLPHNKELGAFNHNGVEVINKALINKNKITKIYLNEGRYNYIVFFSGNPEVFGGYSLIWQRNPNQEKIEEIEETIKQLQEQVEELKND